MAEEEGGSLMTFKEFVILASKLVRDVAVLALSVGAVITFFYMLEVR